MESLRNIIEKFPRLEKFCFCLSIRQGTLFIGWFNSIISVLSLIIFISVIFSGSTEFLNIYGVFVFAAIVFLSVYLLLAVRSGNSRHVYNWVVIEVILVMLNIICMFVTLFLVIPGTFGYSIVSLFWQMYCILVVNTYYTNMDAGPVIF